MERIRSFFSYLRESKDELKKVTWPTRDEVTSYTAVVVVTVLIISVFLWAIDTGLMYLITHVMK
ncbi:MAG: preprotein translocase subunit SecE [Chrysiogenales bacterium]|nr:MAG: preprotein translocase subunit SecE [Chrysiogenales bacterium]